MEDAAQLILLSLIVLASLPIAFLSAKSLLSFSMTVIQQVPLPYSNNLLSLNLFMKL